MKNFLTARLCLNKSRRTHRRNVSVRTLAIVFYSMPARANNNPGVIDIPITVCLSNELAFHVCAHYDSI